MAGQAGAVAEMAGVVDEMVIEVARAMVSGMVVMVVEMVAVEMVAERPVGTEREAALKKGVEKIGRVAGLRVTERGEVVMFAVEQRRDLQRR
mmetsp:Transcript_59187/g.117273  ORF Transcript_59187/g.117273 Transcript_59187/m.117273 type:complete len:92 (+) Transcript_59187:201-476(+)